MPQTFLDSTELVLNMGPQHPSTHGVLRVILKLDGEKVLGTECIIGYLHRGVEKIAENRTYVQFNPYVDRMDYVAAISNGLGYCLAIEKMLNVEAPPRAQAIRVILTELNRIASHLLWLGTHALDIGAITPVVYCLREREEALKIFEKYCGARLTTHALRLRGLLYETYAGYEKYDFEIPTRQNGDTYDRYLVRMEEMRQCVRIMRQAVASIPEGPIMGKVGKVIKPPIGEAYVSIEAPKGELGYYVVSDGATQPYRCRVRPPSFVNLQALDRMIHGGL